MLNEETDSWLGKRVNLINDKLHKQTYMDCAEVFFMKKVTKPLKIDMSDSNFKNVVVTKHRKIVLNAK